MVLADDRPLLDRERRAILCHTHEVTVRSILVVLAALVLGVPPGRGGLADVVEKRRIAKVGILRHLAHAIKDFEQVRPQIVRMMRVLLVVAERRIDLGKDMVEDARGVGEPDPCGRVLWIAASSRPMSLSSSAWIRSAGR
jgi:hypothetical protein